MKTIRLTMAQALVRYLAAQQIRTTGGELPLFHGVFAIFGHGNVAGMGEALAAHREGAADFPRAQRAGDGARGDRLRQGACAPAHDGLHHLDRPGRDQPRDGRCARARQPPARAAAAGRLFASRRPTRSCSRSSTSATRPSPPTIACVRCRGSGIASRGRSSCSRAAAGDLACCPIPADCGPVTLALPQDVQAEACDYPETFSPSACTTSSGRARTASGSQRPRGGPSARTPAAHRRRRRRALCRRRGCARGIRRAPRHPGRRDAGRQGRARLGPRLQCRRDRRHRLERRECAAARSATSCSRIGTRLQDFTTGSGKLFATGDARSSPSTWRGTTPSSARLAAACDAARDARGAARGARGWRRGPAWRERTRTLAARLERRPSTRATRAGARRCRPTRRCWAPSIARSCKGRDGRLRRGRAARRAAQALALRRTRRLSRRVRLLLHGLRDRRRPRCEDGGARIATVVRPGRRRQLPHDEFRDRDLGRARPPLLVVLCDNRGFGCIHRLQRATAGETLQQPAGRNRSAPAPVDFVAHARALGARRLNVPDSRRWKPRSLKPGTQRARP